MAQKTFKRYENKYLLNERQFEALTAVLPQYMRCDEYSDGGGYSIYNVYYDTENDDIIRNSLSKPYYKEKLRMRCYDIPTLPSDKVYLELKKKIGGVVSKRRAEMSLWEAYRFVNSGAAPRFGGYLNGQVASEISEFLALHTVYPKVFISYERQAFTGLHNKDFRLTFDYNIASRRDDVAIKSSCPTTPLLGASMYLMEVKIIGAVPLWLAGMLSGLKIYSTSFSKYGTEYKNFRTQSAQGANAISASRLYVPAAGEAYAQSTTERRILYA